MTGARASLASPACSAGRLPCGVPCCAGWQAEGCGLAPPFLQGPGGASHLVQAGWSSGGPSVSGEGL